MSETSIKTFKNAAIVNTFADLKAIENSDTNIAVCERETIAMQHEIALLMERKVQLKLQGAQSELLKQLAQQLNVSDANESLIYNDIKALLTTFEKISASPTFRLSLLTVASDMCRRFHTDVNDLRLLCTYHGKGTMWLPEEAADRIKYQNGGDNYAIVKNPELIQQTQAGDVIILKGALYPNAVAALHRSPSIEESAEQRLLLRIDTQQFANFS